MRIRTLLALTTGAALGAGATYLLDPVHGEQRRRDARRYALGQARDGAVRALQEARTRTEELAAAATIGYQQAHTEAREAYRGAAGSAPTRDRVAG